MNVNVRRSIRTFLMVVAAGTIGYYFMTRPTSWQQDSECAAVFLYEGNEPLMRSYIDTAVQKAIVDMKKSWMDASVHQAVFGRIDHVYNEIKADPKANFPYHASHCDPKYM